MKTVQVILCKGTGWMSKAIEWQTRGEYSHAAIWFPKEEIFVESLQGKGVRTRDRIAVDSKYDIFSMEVTEEQYGKMLDFALKQIGKSYDWTMIARFISRRQANRESANKWFCSELVFAIFLAAGIELFARTEPWEVHPSLLSKSPLLIKE